MPRNVIPAARTRQRPLGKHALGSGLLALYIAAFVSPLHTPGIRLNGTGSSEFGVHKKKRDGEIGKWKRTMSSKCNQVQFTKSNFKYLSNMMYNTEDWAEIHHYDLIKAVFKSHHLPLLVTTLTQSFVYIGIRVAPSWD